MMGDTFRVGQCANWSDKKPTLIILIPNNNKPGFLLQSLVLHKWTTSHNATHQNPVYSIAWCAIISSTFKVDPNHREHLEIRTPIVAAAMAGASSGMFHNVVINTRYLFLLRRTCCSGYPSWRVRFHCCRYNHLLHPNATIVRLHDRLRQYWSFPTWDKIGPYPVTGWWGQYSCNRRWFSCVATRETAIQRPRMYPYRLGKSCQGNLAVLRRRPWKMDKICSRTRSKSRHQRCC